MEGFSSSKANFPRYNVINESTITLIFCLPIFISTLLGNYLLKLRSVELFQLYILTLIFTVTGSNPPTNNFRQTPIELASKILARKHASSVQTDISRFLLTDIGRKKR